MASFRFQARSAFGALALGFAALISQTGCGTGVIEAEEGVAGEMAPEVSAEETASVEQGLISTKAYYHWSSRSDYAAPAYERCSPALVKLMSYLKSRWGGTNLGCHGNRYVKGQGNSTTWSVHSWGAATDFNSYEGWSLNFGAIADFLIAHSEELGINAIHDYRRVRHSDGTYRGRIWKPGIGWRPSYIGDAGTWMHIEVRPDKFFDDRPVEAKLVAERVGADGCTTQQRADAAAFGCACVNGKPNGGWCPGTGCTAAQTDACAAFAAGCVDGKCNGIFAPGYGCTKLEYKNCGTYLSGCTNHKCLAGRVGGDDGRHCSEQTLYNCGQYGCGCNGDQCSDGSCPIIP